MLTILLATEIIGAEPAVEDGTGLTLELVKAHLRVTHSDEDTLIESYMAAAKAWIEKTTGKRLSVVTVTERFTKFGSYIWPVAAAPIESVSSISYVDRDGATQTLTGYRYRDGRIYPPLTGWPAIEDYSTITVTYQAGYSDLPDDLLHAQLLLIGHFYQNREAVNVGNIVNEVPFAVDALIQPYRLILV